MDHITVTQLREPSDELIRYVAAALDHPSVYMGGPSHRSQRQAKRVLSIIADHVEGK